MKRSIAHQPLANDLAGLLIEYCQQHGILADDPLLQTLQSYGRKQLTMSRWLEHLAELAERTKSPNIGLRIGQMVQASHAGVNAYLALSCDTLGQALLQFQRVIRRGG